MMLMPSVSIPVKEELNYKSLPIKCNNNFNIFSVFYNCVIIRVMLEQYRRLHKLDYNINKSFP